MQVPIMTERELAQNGVAALPLTPTASPAFGGRDYTPQEMKAAFDRLPRFIAARLNALLAATADGTILADIPVTYGDGTLPLHDVLGLITEHLEAGDDFDEAPTAGSENAITSGAVYRVLDELREQIRQTAAGEADAALRAQSLTYDKASGRLSLGGATGERAYTTVSIPLPTVQEEVSLLRAILGALILSDTVADTYTARVTAGGLSVIDGAPTTVRRIEGVTEANSRNRIPSRTRSTYADSPYGEQPLSSSGADGTVCITGDMSPVTGEIPADAYEDVSEAIVLTAGTYSLCLPNLPSRSDPRRAIWRLRASTADHDGECLYEDIAVLDSRTAAGETMYVTFTVTEEQAARAWTLCVFCRREEEDASTVFSAYEETPMLLSGDISDEGIPDFEPCRAGQRTGAFGGICSTGRNLLRELVAEGVEKNGITLETDPQAGTVTINGSPTNSYFSKTVAENFYLPRGTYTMYAPNRSRRFVGWLVKNQKSKTVGKIDWAELGGVVARSFTLAEAGYYYLQVYIPSGYEYPSFDNYVETPMILPGSLSGSDLPAFEAYRADTTFALPTPLSLGRWDYINVEAGKCVLGTETKTQETPFTAEQLAAYEDYILSADGKTIAYERSTPSEASLPLPKWYTAWRGGMEYLLADAAKTLAPALPLTVTQDFYVKTGGDAA